MLNPNLVSDLIYHSSINTQLFAADTASVRQALRNKGVDFEGRALPVSLKPNLIDVSAAYELATDLALVRQALNKLIDGLRSELVTEKVGRLSAFFADYQQWFSIIASEVRRLDPIMLMRFDTVRRTYGSHLAVEPNACCPGGVIHPARVRKAWLQTTLGQRYASTFEIKEMPIDDEYGFAKFILSLAKRYPARNVAVCNYNGTYNFELAALVEAGHVVKRDLDLNAGQIIFCDIRELSIRDGLTYAKDVPVGLIYNKIDATMIRAGDPEISDWHESSRSKHCDFLNSLGAMYIGESKSAFAALMDESIQNLIGLEAPEINAIKRRIPATVSIPTLKKSDMLGDVVTNRHNYVLKPNYESRGVGVLLGRQTDHASWTRALAAYDTSGGVAQEAIDIETRLVREASTETDELIDQIEFFGTDVFFFGSNFAGVVGRSHTDPIINVGNGGRELPTLVVSGYLNTMLDVRNPPSDAT